MYVCMYVSVVIQRFSKQIFLPSAILASENMIELFKFNLPAKTTDGVDLPALARLLRKVTIPDEKWEGARVRSASTISSTISSVNDDPQSS